MAKTRRTPPPRSEAFKRFIDSMEMNYERWREGTGYDLEALAQLQGDERKEVEWMLLAGPRSEWRNQEALAALGSDQALRALESDLHSKSAATRLYTAIELHEMGRLKDIGSVLDGVLKEAVGDSTLFSRTIDQIGWRKPESVIPTLLEIVRSGPGDKACTSAAMLYYLKGIAKAPFDWNHRPFFLRFNTEDPAQRAAAFEELLEKLGSTDKTAGPQRSSRIKSESPGRSKPGGSK